MKTFASMFTGGGLADVGAIAAGYKPIWGIEIDPAIAEVARFNLKHDVIARSVLDIAPSTLDRPDVLWASPPCFPAGVKVLTRAGLKDIADIKIGDMVLTHKGRWRAVSHVMTRRADTMILHGLGHCGLEVTPNHPFFASEVVNTYPPYKERKPGNYVLKSMSAPAWVNAENMLGKHWLSLREYPAVEVDRIEYSFHESLRGQRFDLSNPCFWWVVGAWLGDGWIRYSDGKGHLRSRGSVYICAGNHEADMLEGRLNLAGFKFSRSQERTTTRFSIESRPLARWLTRNFGKYAHGKTLPVWAYGMPHENKKALLDGFVFADGSICHPPSFNDPATNISTVSPDLAISIKILGVSLGYSVSVRKYSRARSATIEGRSVNERPSYSIRLTSSDRHAKFVEHDSVLYRSGCVKKIEVGREDVEVYDITVDEDESFIADGIVVHNCPNFSAAKANAQETELDQALAQAIVDFITTLKPPVFILENVQGYSRSKSFKSIEGALFALGYWVDRQIINAADFGVPQTRRRLILRAVLGGFPPSLPPKEKWIGWYESIEDLIPALPESKLAQWQIDRLPKSLASILIDGQNCRSQESGCLTTRDVKQPAFTVCASGSNGRTRAVLISGTGDRQVSRALIEPAKVVAMTPRALARFQTLPDWYELPEKNQLACKIIGNGVPCLLVEKLLRLFD